MFRTTDIIMVTIMVSAAAFTYKIKNDTDKMRSEIARIEKKISTEKDSMNLLKADWSLLTQPSRLQRLVNAYGDELDLQPVRQRPHREHLGALLRSHLRRIPLRRHRGHPGIRPRRHLHADGAE